MATIGELLKGGPLPAAPQQMATDERRMSMKISSVQAEKVEWWWEPYLPHKMVTIITGDPGIGKGWVICSVASHLTRGIPLPSAKTARPPTRVLLFAVEDVPSILRYRLELQGADLDRVIVVPHVLNLTGESGMGVMKKQIAQHQPGIVVVDPITSFMGDSDPNKQTVVNAFFSTLSKLAQEMGVAIVAVRHRRKPADGERKGRDPKFSGVGSIGFQGGARGELLVGMTEDGYRAMAQVKNSLGPEGPTQAFTLDPECGRLTWEGESEIEDWELVGKMKKKRGDSRGVGRPPEKMEEACAWLRSALGGGKRIAAEVYGEAAKAGLARKTVSQAKGVLGVRAWNEGGVWWLEMGGGAHA